MSRFRNQLLHHPRSSLRAAAAAGDSADPHPLLDAARRVFGLADAPHGRQAGPRTPENRRQVIDKLESLPDGRYIDRIRKD